MLLVSAEVAGAGDLGGSVLFGLCKGAGLTIVVLLCLLTSSGAEAAVPFCGFGAGAGQCNRPHGVAVNQTTGTVYVADSGNDRINAFDEDGNLLFAFGESGLGPGQLSNPQQLAVDNDPASLTYQD